MATGRISHLLVKTARLKESIGYQLRSLITITSVGKLFLLMVHQKDSDSAKIEAETSKDSDKADREFSAPLILPVTYPNMAYGFEKLPQQETILFKNATVWTNEDEGIMTETDVLVKKGKIVKIGKNLSASGAKVVDATGKTFNCWCY